MIVDRKTQVSTLVKAISPVLFYLNNTGAGLASAGVDSRVIFPAMASLLKKNITTAGKDSRLDLTVINCLAEIVDDNPTADPEVLIDLLIKVFASLGLLVEDRYWDRVREYDLLCERREARKNKTNR